MLVSGLALMAGVLASSGAQAQCSGNGIQENFPFGAGGSVNALTSVISTANTAFMNNGSPFVSAPAAVPDQQGGGIWIRTVGGTVETQANSNFSGSFSLTQNGWFGLQLRQAPHRDPAIRKWRRTMRASKQVTTLRFSIPIIQE